jgi:Bacteriophage HK97-gp10, putative tail-component
MTSASVVLPIEIEIDAADLSAALTNVVGLLDETLSEATAEAARIVADAAHETAAFTDRTGQLRASIQPSDPPATGSFFRGDLEGSVGFGATSNGFPYGLALEFGSAPHVITPKHRRALRFAGGGGWVFATKVNHPGTKEGRFMRDALDSSAPAITQAFESSIDDAIERAGLK